MKSKGKKVGKKDTAFLHSVCDVSGVTTVLFRIIFVLVGLFAGYFPPVESINKTMVSSS